MNNPQSEFAWSNLVSQVTGSSLSLEGERLIADDGAEYQLRNGIADILDPRLLDAAASSELEIFDGIPIENVCYFRDEVFSEIIGTVIAYLGDGPKIKVCVEIGGGEGYFANAFRELVENAVSYVVDLSEKHLRNADDRLFKIRCDARSPYLVEKTADVAAFWVSLHHLKKDDMQKAMATAARTLKPGGILLIFEPNDSFLPRRLFYKLKLSRQVYFDDEEKGVSRDTVRELAACVKLKECCAASINPPYNKEFLKHFKNWPLFYAITESLFIIGKFLGSHIKAMRPTGAENGKMLLKPFYAGSYMFAIYESCGGDECRQDAGA